MWFPVCVEIDIALLRNKKWPSTASVFPQMLMTSTKCKHLKSLLELSCLTKQFFDILQLSHSSWATWLIPAIAAIVIGIMCRVYMFDHKSSWVTTTFLSSGGLEMFDQTFLKLNPHIRECVHQLQQGMEGNSLIKYFFPCPSTWNAQNRPFGQRLY